MSYINVEGFDDLLKTIDNLGDVGKRVTNSALKNAMQPGLEIIKKNAPKDTKGGSEALKIGTIKRYKDGGCVGKMGIDGSNWEDCKGLWYQHWGYENYGGRYNGYKGRVTKNVGWFNEATDKAEATILDNLEREINVAYDKILK